MKSFEEDKIITEGLQLVAVCGGGLDDSPNEREVRDITAVYEPAYLDELNAYGLFDALWRMGEEYSVGLEVEAGRIPVSQYMIEACENRGINPYRQPVQGDFLLAVADGFGAVRAFLERGISAEIIGHITGGNDRIVIFKDHIQYLTPMRPQQERR